MSPYTKEFWKRIKSEMSLSSVINLSPSRWVLWLGCLVIAHAVTTVESWWEEHSFAAPLLLAACIAAVVLFCFVTCLVGRLIRWGFALLFLGAAGYFLYKTIKP